MAFTPAYRALSFPSPPFPFAFRVRSPCKPTSPPAKTTTEFAPRTLEPYATDGKPPSFSQTGNSRAWRSPERKPTSARVRYDVAERPWSAAIYRSFRKSRHNSAEASRRSKRRVKPRLRKAASSRRHSKAAPPQIGTPSANKTLHLTGIPLALHASQ